MWVATGSADETPELNGVSHFLEHMLFKGTDRYGVGEIDRMIEGVGGIINAGTSHDFTHYYVTVGSDDLATAVEIIAEVIRHSSLVEEEIDRERQVILEEYSRKQDDPQGLLWERLYDLAFEQGPYKAPVLGVPESLEAIGRTNMLDYYRRHYCAENMALLIVGDVAPEAALSLASEAFDGFDRPPRPLLDRSRSKTVYRPGAETEIEKDVNETYAVTTFPAPPLQDRAQVCALEVLQYVLGGGRASILYREIKERRRLATSIGASYPTSRHPNLFAVHYTCDGAKRSELERVSLEEIDRVVQSGVSEKDLDRARNLLTNEHAFSLETTNGQSSAIGYYYTVTGGLEFERDYVGAIRAVTREQVQEQARQWLRPSEICRVAVRPKKT